MGIGLELLVSQVTQRSIPSKGLGVGRQAGGVPAVVAGVLTLYSMALLCRGQTCGKSTSIKKRRKISRSSSWGPP